MIAGIFAVIEENRFDVGVAIEDAEEVRATITPMTDNADRDAHGYLCVVMYKYTMKGQG